MNRSRQPISVGVVKVFPEGSGVRSSEMSIHGSYVVDVKPHAVHMTSERKIPENTLCAMQQSPLPVKKIKIPENILKL